jgi:hypothetical protein
VKIIRCTVQPEEMVPGALIAAAASFRAVISARAGLPCTASSMIHLRIDDMTGHVSLRDGAAASTLRWSMLWSAA